jgi:acyl-CoA thioester hydrolase
MSGQRQENGSRPLLRHRFRVAMGDTDAAQVIYFAAPTRWAERMASEWLAEAGFATSRQLAAGYGMPAVHVELTYHGPLRLDDEIDATLWLDKLSTRSFTLRSEFRLADAQEPAVQMRMTQVYARTSGAAPEACPMPDTLVSHLRGHAVPPPHPASH